MKKALLVALAAMAASAFAEGPKYVFLFIGDGMSVPQRMTADEFSVKKGDGLLTHCNAGQLATAKYGTDVSWTSARL